MDFPKSKPCACTAASERSSEELLQAANKLSSGANFVLVTRNAADLEKRLLSSFLCAFLRYQEGEMRSDSLQKEVMLFVAGTMNIRNAIASIGVQSNKQFVVFASNKTLCSSFLKAVYGKKLKELKLVVDEDTAPSIAAVGIKEN